MQGRTNKTRRDVLLISLLVVLMSLIAATGPSHTYRFAQFWQVGAAIDINQNGRVFLPHTQVGVFRKGPLYAWMLAPVLAVTGMYDDWVFRVPNMAATLGLALLVYALGRRWYGRSTGLLAAAFWTTSLHMGKLVYIALTDMLLSFWIMLAIFCLDRLLFHPDPRGGSMRWRVGFWAAMILGALTKGWGLVNVSVVGLFALLALLLRGRYRPDRSWAAQALGRLWWAMRRTALGPGLLAMAMVVGPVLAGAALQGGQAFADVLYFEIFQRFTGAGEHAPRPASMPVILYLMYWQLPASIFAASALALALPCVRRTQLRRAMGLLVGPGAAWYVRLRARMRLVLWNLRIVGRHWTRRSSPILLPLCWLTAVFVPFSLSHGFRPDYLLPCYPAMALLAAWAVERLVQLRPLQSLRIQIVRHAQAGMGVTVGVLLALAAAIYLGHDQLQLPALLRRGLGNPAHLGLYRRIALALATVLGAASVVLVIRMSLRWQMRKLAFVCILLMLGVNVLAVHVVNPAARTMDGDKMLRFARQARRHIADDPYATFRMEKMGTEVYVGRWAALDLDQPRWQEQLARRDDVSWLVTCDRGLVELGCAIGPLKSLEPDHVRKKIQQALTQRPEPQRISRRLEGLDSDLASRGYALKGSPRPGLYVVLPELLGTVAHKGRKVYSQNWGAGYLIQLRRPPLRLIEPVPCGYVTGDPEDRFP
jgi:4-amino-4-deoxy-L-arabinose transferase-like glycosyltransferase